MRCTSVPGLIVLLAIACSTTDASGPQANPPGRPGATPGHTDFKVVVWYRRDRPLDTFKYQVYDVRKSQYTPAVDAWLQLLRTKYPAYDVTIREVDLAREQGETESLKVGSVIKRELLAAAAREGIVIGYGVAGFQLPTIAPKTGLAAPARISQAAPQGTTLDRSSYLNPPGSTFPFPMPYPRPHP